LLIESPFPYFWGTPVRPLERDCVLPVYMDAFAVFLAMPYAGFRPSFSVHGACTATSFILQLAKLVKKPVGW
jgi:hypothetical protein